MTQERAPYPPPEHMLADLRIAIARDGDDLRVELPAPPETRGRGGAVSAGVLGVAVDVLGGNLALRAVAPDWCVTSTLALHLLRPIAGDFHVTGRALRAGRTQVVLDVEAHEGTGPADAGADDGQAGPAEAGADDGQAGPAEAGADDGHVGPAAVASMTFTRIPRRADTLEYRDRGEPYAFGGPGSRLRAPFTRQLGCRVLDAAAGEVELPLVDYVRNSVGALQGGAVVALVDAAAEAVAGARLGADAVTRDVEIHYLALGREGPIRSRVRWLAGDAREARLRVELVDTGQHGRLLSVATVALAPL